jgi:hypothetical protein
MRFLLRLLGYALLLAAFAVGVMDAARSQANGALSLKPLGQSLYEVLAERYLLLQPAIERHVSQGLWEHVVLPVTLWPTALVALGLGVILLLLGNIPRRPRPVDDA